MTHAQQTLAPQPTLSRSGEQIVAALRELEENRLVGILRDEDYGSQRAERFNLLLRPMRGLWLAELLGAALVGAPAGALIWFLTGQQYYTIGIAAVHKIIIYAITNIGSKRSAFCIICKNCWRIIIPE